MTAPRCVTWFRLVASAVQELLYEVAGLRRGDGLADSSAFLSPGISAAAIPALAHEAGCLPEGGGRAARQFGRELVCSTGGVLIDDAPHQAPVQRPIGVHHRAANQHVQSPYLADCP